MDKWIWLDMDGTIVDFYGVQGWLADLEARRTRPYDVAHCLYNVYELFELFVELREKGYKIGIISWSSKARDKAFDKAVTKAKKEWLYMNCLDMVIDKVIVTAYGVNKADTCRPYGYGILVDDEEQNRTSWDLGLTVDATEDIIKRLRALV